MERVAFGVLGVVGVVAGVWLNPHLEPVAASGDCESARIELPSLPSMADLPSVPDLGGVPAMVGLPPAVKIPNGIPELDGPRPRYPDAVFVRHGPARQRERMAPDAVVLDSAALERIDAMVSDDIEAFRSCFPATAITRQTVEFRVTIEADGTVSNAWSDAAVRADLEFCVAQHFRELQFDPPGAPVHIVYPLTFSRTELTSYLTSR